MDGNTLLTARLTMKAATKSQEAKLNELAMQIAKAQNDFAERMKTVSYADPADAKEPSKLASDPKHSFKTWRVAAAKDAKGVPKELVALVKSAKLDAAGEAKLREHYLRNVCVDTKAVLDPLTKQITALTKERDGINGAVQGTFASSRTWRTLAEASVMMRRAVHQAGRKSRAEHAETLLAADWGKRIQKDGRRGSTWRTGWSRRPTR